MNFSIPLSNLVGGRALTAPLVLIFCGIVQEK